MTKITKLVCCLIPCLGLGLISLVSFRHTNTDAVQKIPQQVQAPQKVKKTSQDNLANAVTELRSRTASISRTMITEEQQRIQEAREQYNSFQDDQPRMEIVQDEYGMHWRRLSYSDGRIRYELPDQG